jgi:hypothetical protein
LKILQKIFYIELKLQEAFILPSADQLFRDKLRNQYGIDIIYNIYESYYIQKFIDDAPNIIKRFFSMVERQFNQQVKILWSDNET